METFQRMIAKSELIEYNYDYHQALLTAKHTEHTMYLYGIHDGQQLLTCSFT